MKRILQLLILVFASAMAIGQSTQRFSDLALYIGFGDSTKVPVLLKVGGVWVNRLMYAVDLHRGAVDSIRIHNDSVYQWNAGVRTFVGMASSTGGGGGLTQGQTDALYVPLSRTVAGHTLNSNVTLVKADVGLSNVANVDQTNPTNISQDATHRFATDAEKTSWNAKQSPLATGLTTQYYDGTQALRTFPTVVSAFSNDAGYLNPGTGDSRYPLKAGFFDNPTWITGLDWTKIENVPNYVQTINTATPTAISGLISGNNSQLVSQTTIADPITYNYATTTLGIKIANTVQDGALAHLDYINFNTAYGWGNHRSIGYLTRDSIPDDSTVLLDPLTTIVGINGQNDTMMVFNADSLGQAGVILSSQYKRFQYATQAWTASGSYNSGTGVITYTRNDGTTWTVTGVTGIGLPSMTSNANKLLTNNASTASWTTNLTWDNATLGGVLKLGTSTSSQTANTTIIDMGGTFNGSIKNFKFYLLNDGTAKYGFGANLGEVAYIISDNFSDHVFYMNGDEALRIINDAATNNPGALYIEKGLKMSRTTVADAAYTMLKSDYLIAYTSITVSRAVTLPTAASVIGQHFTDKG
jgi:hypothetical protein